MSDAATGLIDITVPVLGAFVNVTEPKKFKGANGKEKGDPKYQISFVFPPDHPDLKTIKDRTLAIAQAKWPGRDIQADVKAGNFKLPWASGDKLADKRIAGKRKKDPNWKDDGKGDFQRGKTVLKTSSKYAPGLAYVENGKVSPNLEGAAINLHKSKFYFGCDYFATINLVAYDKIDEDGKDGVTAYIQTVVSLNRGTRLSGGAQATEKFQDYAGKLKSEDPTKGNDELGDDEDAF